MRARLVDGDNRQVPIALRLDHCVIAVSDWVRSNAFYRDVLAAELVELDRGRFA